MKDSNKKSKAVLKITNRSGVCYYPGNCRIKFQDGKIYEVDGKGTLRRVRS
jgi:hypothetical protein